MAGFLRNNPLLELVAERQRAAKLTRDLPALIERQVGEQIQELEERLLRDFRNLGDRALTESAGILSARLGDRIGSLEKASACHSQALLNLRDSSRTAERKVSEVLENFAGWLTDAVPGFRLPPTGRPRHPQFQLDPGTDVVKAGPRELAEVDGRQGHCPSCTSQNVRRASRSGLFESFLRLFFIAPFRCRACRHKFYRF